MGLFSRPLPAGEGLTGPEFFTERRLWHATGDRDDAR